MERIPDWAVRGVLDALVDMTADRVRLHVAEMARAMDLDILVQRPGGTVRSPIATPRTRYDVTVDAQRMGGTIRATLARTGHPSEGRTTIRTRIEDPIADDGGLAPQAAERTRSWLSTARDLDLRDAVIRAEGLDPASAPAWAFTISPVAYALTRHHGIASDRLCTTWRDAVSRRGGRSDFVRMRPVDEAGCIVYMIGHGDALSIESSRFDMPDGTQVTVHEKTTETEIRIHDAAIPHMLEQAAKRQQLSDLIGHPAFVGIDAPVIDMRNVGGDLVVRVRRRARRLEDGPSWR